MKRSGSHFMLATLVVVVLAALVLNTMSVVHHSRESPQSSYDGRTINVGADDDSPDVFRIKAKALPSVRLAPRDEARLGINRKQYPWDRYGGVGDKPHLGGFTDLDMMGISPQTWDLMLRYVGVQSVVDLGCGKGVSTLWFQKQGVKATCVEGSHDAVTKSLLPPQSIVEHDFTRGPWWPDETVDAVWCVEFAEHVQRQYIRNYVQVFKKAAIIFVTHSQRGGYHHAEVHHDEWWILKYESFGLRFSAALTNMTRTKAWEEYSWRRPSPIRGKYFDGQHIRTNMLVSKDLNLFNVARVEWIPVRRCFSTQWWLVDGAMTIFSPSPAAFSLLSGAITPTTGMVSSATSPAVASCPMASVPRVLELS